jgi:hypothetical protein
MATETKYGDAYVNAPGSLTPSIIEGKVGEGHVKSSISKSSMGAGASSASTYDMTQVPSNAILQPDSKLYHDGLSSSVTCDITAVKPSTGSVGPTSLATALDISSAGSKDLLENIGIENYGKELWELAGFSSDPGETMVIRVDRVTDGGGVAGDIVTMTRYAISG